MSGSTFVWTPEQSGVLRTLVSSGSSFAESAAAINLQFGTAFTRNAAVGKGKRMGLVSLNRPKAVAPKPRTASKRPIPAPIIKQQPYTPRCAPVIPRNIPLVELEPNDCRYIPGDDHLYCGHPAKYGSAMCEAHHALCWEAARPRPIPARYAA